MEICENNEPTYLNQECSEYEKIVKLLQSSRVDAAEQIFEEMKKSIIKRKGRWLHDDRVWPHQNGKTNKKEITKKEIKKLKIVDNQELYTRFVPANHTDENKPITEKKKEKSDDIFDLTQEDEKPEIKRLTLSHRNETKKEESNSKKNKTDTAKSKDDHNTKTDKLKSNDETNGKTDKYPSSSIINDDVELLLSLSSGDQDSAEPKVLRKRKEVKKESPALHKISNGGVHKKKQASAASANQAKKGSLGSEPLFFLKENMKNREQDGLDSAKTRQKMFYGSTQVTRRDKPRREGTLADDSKKRLEAKLKKVKAKLKKSA